MWDLIVSVPDRCLSFYFLRCIGYLSFTKDCIKHDLLQTQVLLLQLNFLNYFNFLPHCCQKSCPKIL